MNAFEREALDVVGSRLDRYPVEHRALGRLDDRVVGWLTFHPHAVLAVVAAGLGGMQVLLWSVLANRPWVWPTIAAVAVLAPGGWLLGRWQWRRYTLPWLEVLADAVASGRGEPGSAGMPLGWEFRVSAAVSRLRRMQARERGSQ